MQKSVNNGSGVPSIAILSFTCLMVLGIAWLATQSRVEQQEQRLVEQQLMAVLGDVPHSNVIVDDKFILRTSSAPDTSTTTVYRARNNGNSVAAVYDTATPEGYGGIIRMLVGIDFQQSITGVRIVAHRETPGLGDGIDLEKSDWIRGFDNLSLEIVDSSDWQVKKDGGRFDQFTGATITPRAVVNRIHDILLIHQKHSERIFTQPSGTQYTVGAESE